MSRIGGKNPIPRKIVLVIFLCLATAACVPLFKEYNYLINSDSRDWNINDIVAYLKVQMPNDATNIKYTVGTTRAFFLNLTFKASPTSVLSFTGHFCNGVLNQGYDPFNAINSDEWIPRSVRIDLIHPYARSYYSYSPRTSQLKTGVFCDFPNGYFWVLVDQTDPALYIVKLKHTLDLNEIYPDVKPVADFPIMVRGLLPELHGGYSAWGTICLDLDPDAVGGPSGKWNSLIGSDLQVSIDGRAMTSAYVSSEGRLVRKDGMSNYSDPDSELFKYCLLMWRSGLHTMSVQIPAGTGSKTAYSWAVRGQDTASCENHPNNDCYGS